MGRTEEANTNRLLVLLQMPLLLVASLTFIGLSDAFKGGRLADGILAPVPLALQSFRWKRQQASSRPAQIKSLRPTTASSM
ncbi:MAG: hypothetical protein EON56_05910 [Alphaproteobacteria bacterium]|nr:MAG: hypothetical protein EON56_05910 [Alphaproteobacteria bacterium]